MTTEEYEETKEDYEELTEDGERIVNAMSDKVDEIAEDVRASKKRWFKSKTVWLNVLAITIIALQYVGGVSKADTALMETGALAMINLVLRGITKDRLTR